MDSTTYVTVTEVTKSVSHEIWTSLPPFLWFILYCGWLFYWGKKMQEINASPAHDALSIFEKIKLFWKENWMEVPSSALSCMILGIVTELPPSVMGAKIIIIFVFGLGYSNGSALNFLITQGNVKGRIAKQFQSKNNASEDAPPLGGN